MTDLRDFPPVEEKVERPDTLRQSLLDKLDRCPRSAYLYLKYGGGVQSHAMARGSAFHAMVEEATNLMRDNEESEFPPDMARELVQHYIEESPDPIPVHEHEPLRAMAWNWAKATVINPAHVVGIEQKLALKLGKWIVTGTIDLLMAGAEGEAEIRDYKTSLALPDQEKFERQFQGMFYALLVAEGYHVATDKKGGLVWGAKVCETAPSAYRVRQIYPRFYFEDTGRLAERQVVYDKADLLDLKVAVEGILARADHGLKTGEWPAVPGAHCSLCPAPQECPIPEQFRLVTTIESREDAQKMAERWDRLVGETNRLRGALRSWAEQNGSIPIGDDQELTFFPVRSEPIKNKPALKEALAKGEYKPEDFFSQRTQTRFDKRTRNG